MIDKKDIKDLVLSNLKENHFLIDVTVSPANQIQVFIDCIDGLPISECISYSRLIENHFDREKEDYELSVSSGGLDLPFTVPKQYDKYLGKEVELITNEGIKQDGLLISHDENTMVLEVEVKELIEGRKRKVLVKKELEFLKTDTKTVKPVFSFKKNKKK